MANGITLKNPPEEILKLIIETQYKFEKEKLRRINKSQAIIYLLKEAYIKPNGKT
jgi:hypothetical protein